MINGSDGTDAALSSWTVHNVRSVVASSNGISGASSDVFFGHVAGATGRSYLSQEKTLSSADQLALLEGKFHLTRLHARLGCKSTGTSMLRLQMGANELALSDSSGNSKLHFKSNSKCGFSFPATTFNVLLDLSTPAAGCFGDDLTAVFYTSPPVTGALNTNVLDVGTSALGCVWPGCVGTKNSLSIPTTGVIQRHRLHAFRAKLAAGERIEAVGAFERMSGHTDLSLSFSNQPLDAVPTTFTGRTFATGVGTRKEVTVRVPRDATWIRYQFSTKGVVRFMTLKFFEASKTVPVRMSSTASPTSTMAPPKTPSVTVSNSKPPTTTASRTATLKASVTATGSVTDRLSRSATSLMSSSPSAAATVTSSRSPSSLPTITSTIVATRTLRQTPTDASASLSISRTHSPSLPPTPSFASTSLTVTKTVSRSLRPSSSLASASTSRTMTGSASLFQSPSFMSSTVTNSMTLSKSPSQGSGTVTLLRSHSQSPMPSVTGSTTATSSVTVTATRRSMSMSSVESATVSLTISRTIGTETPTMRLSRSWSKTATTRRSVTSTVATTKSLSCSRSFDIPRSVTQSATLTAMASASAGNKSATVSSTVSMSASTTGTHAPSVSATHPTATQSSTKELQFPESVPALGEVIVQNAKVGVVVVGTVSAVAGVSVGGGVLTLQRVAALASFCEPFEEGKGVGVADHPLRFTFGPWRTRAYVGAAVGATSIFIGVSSALLIVAVTVALRRGATHHRRLSSADNGVELLTPSRDVPTAALEVPFLSTETTTSASAPVVVTGNSETQDCAGQGSSIHDGRSAVIRGLQTVRATTIAAVAFTVLSPMAVAPAVTAIVHGYVAAERLLGALVLLLTLSVPTVAAVATWRACRGRVRFAPRQNAVRMSELRRRFVALAALPKHTTLFEFRTNHTDAPSMDPSMNSPMRSWRTEGKIDHHRESDASMVTVEALSVLNVTGDRHGTHETPLKTRCATKKTSPGASDGYSTASDLGALPPALPVVHSAGFESHHAYDPPPVLHIEDGGIRARPRTSNDVRNVATTAPSSPSIMSPTKSSDTNTDLLCLVPPVGINDEDSDFDGLNDPLAHSFHTDDAASDEVVPQFTSCSFVRRAPEEFAEGSYRGLSFRIGGRGIAPDKGKDKSSHDDDDEASPTDEQCVQFSFFGNATFACDAVQANQIESNPTSGSAPMVSASAISAPETDFLDPPVIIEKDRSLPRLVWSWLWRATGHWEQCAEVDSSEKSHSAGVMNGAAQQEMEQRSSESVQSITPKRLDDSNTTRQWSHLVLFGPLFAVYRQRWSWFLLVEVYSALFLAAVSAASSAEVSWACVVAEVLAVAGSVVLTISFLVLQPYATHGDTALAIVSAVLEIVAAGLRLVGADTDVVVGVLLVLACVGILQVIASAARKLTRVTEALKHHLFDAPKNKVPSDTTSGSDASSNADDDVGDIHGTVDAGAESSQCPAQPELASSKESDRSPVFHRPSSVSQFSFSEFPPPQSQRRSRSRNVSFRFNEDREAPESPPAFSFSFSFAAAPPAVSPPTPPDDSDHSHGSYDVAGNNQCLAGDIAVTLVKDDAGLAAEPAVVAHRVQTAQLAELEAMLQRRIL